MSIYGKRAHNPAHGGSSSRSSAHLTPRSNPSTTGNLRTPRSKTSTQGTRTPLTAPRSRTPASERSLASVMGRTLADEAFTRSTRRAHGMPTHVAESLAQGDMMIDQFMELMASKSATSWADHETFQVMYTNFMKALWSTRQDPRMLESITQQLHHVLSLAFNVVDEKDDIFARDLRNNRRKFASLVLYNTASWVTKRWLYRAVRRWSVAARHEGVSRHIRRWRYRLVIACFTQWTAAAARRRVRKRLALPRMTRHWLQRQKRHGFSTWRTATFAIMSRDVFDLRRRHRRGVGRELRHLEEASWSLKRLSFATWVAWRRERRLRQAYRARTEAGMRVTEEWQGHALKAWFCGWAKHTAVKQRARETAVGRLGIRTQEKQAAAYRRWAHVSALCGRQRGALERLQGLIQRSAMKRGLGTLRDARIVDRSISHHTRKCAHRDAVDQVLRFVHTTLPLRRGMQGLRQAARASHKRRLGLGERLAVRAIARIHRAGLQRMVQGAFRDWRRRTAKQGLVEAFLSRRAAAAARVCVVRALRAWTRAVTQWHAGNKLRARALAAWRSIRVTKIAVSSSRAVLTWKGELTLRTAVAQERQRFQQRLSERARKNSVLARWKRAQLRSLQERHAQLRGNWISRCGGGLLRTIGMTVTRTLARRFNHWKRKTGVARIIEEQNLQHSLVCGQLVSIKQYQATQWIVRTLFRAVEHRCLRAFGRWRESTEIKARATAVVIRWITQLERSSLHERFRRWVRWCGVLRAEETRWHLNKVWGAMVRLHLRLGFDHWALDYEFFRRGVRARCRRVLAAWVWLVRHRRARDRALMRMAIVWQTTLRRRGLMTWRRHHRRAQLIQFLCAQRAAGAMRAALTQLQRCALYEAHREATASQQALTHWALSLRRKRVLEDWRAATERRVNGRRLMARFMRWMLLGNLGKAWRRWIEEVAVFNLSTRIVRRMLKHTLVDALERWARFADFHRRVERMLSLTNKKIVANRVQEAFERWCFKVYRLWRLAVVVRFRTLRVVTRAFDEWKTRCESARWAQAHAKELRGIRLRSCVTRVDVRTKALAFAQLVRVGRCGARLEALIGVVARFQLKHAVREWMNFLSVRHFHRSRLLGLLVASAQGRVADAFRRWERRGVHAGRVADAMRRLERGHEATAAHCAARRRAVWLGVVVQEWATVARLEKDRRTWLGRMAAKKHARLLKQAMASWGVRALQLACFELESEFEGCRMDLSSARAQLSETQAEKQKVSEQLSYSMNVLEYVMANQ